MTLNSNPIRILHVVGGLNKGGLETFIMNIYRNIDREKIQFDFAVLNKNEMHYYEEIKSLGGNIYIQPDPRKQGMSEFKKSLIETIDKKGPYKCIHSHIYYFNGIIMKIARLNNVEVRISHSHTSGDLNQSSNIIRKAYRKYMRRLIIKNSTKLVGCSELACKSLFGENLYKKDKAEILNNGIDLSLYIKSDIDKSKNRKKLGIKDDEIVIGHIGRFVKEKNHEFLINVFEKIIEIDKNKNYKLILVGDGPLKPNIEKIVNEKNLSKNVEFMGIRNDIPEILSAIDIFLFPSVVEGLGIVLVEAQASGTHCIISDTIPKEVNFGMGLIHPIGLNRPASQWAENTIQCINNNVCEFEKRKHIISSHGYDIGYSVDRLKEIYLNKGV